MIADPSLNVSKAPHSRGETSCPFVEAKLSLSRAGDGTSSRVSCSTICRLSYRQKQVNRRHEQAGRFPEHWVWTRCVFLIIKDGRASRSQADHSLPAALLGPIGTLPATCGAFDFSARLAQSRGCIYPLFRKGMVRLRGSDGLSPTA